MAQTAFAILNRIVARFPKISRVFFVLFIVVMASGLFLALSPEAWAISLLDSIEEIVAEAFAYLLLWLTSLVGRLLIVFLDILIGIAQYNGFSDAPAINEGWPIVRDVCNMLFVLVLLVIAFGTVLRLENYKYNRLLAKLVIMAILVNFSKMIAGFFIDISQVIMLTFVNAFSQVAYTNFTSILSLDGLLSIVAVEGEAAANVSPPNAADIIAVPALALIMVLVGTMTILGMLLVFLMRIVMLWILVVLSPVAYLLATLPVGSQYSGRWWSTFSKWVTTGPLLAFFIWLALAILPEGADENLGWSNVRNDVFSTGNVGEAEVYATLSATSSSRNILSFILSIGMFLAGLSFASSVGGVAGTIAGNMFSRVKRMGSGTLRAAGAPLRGAYKAGRYGVSRSGAYVGRKLRESDLKVGAFTPSMLTPEFWKGFSERGKRLDERAKKRATGKGLGWAEEKFKGKKAALDAEELAERAILVEIQSDFKKAMGSASDSRQAMQDIARKSFYTDGFEGDEMRQAAIEMFTAQGNTDDVWEDFSHKYHTDEQFQTDVRKRFGNQGFSNDDVDEMFREMDMKNTRAFMAAYVGLDKKFLGPEGEQESINAKDEDRRRLRSLAAASESAKKVGHWEQVNTIKDPETGGYILMSPEHQVEENLGEALKIDSRTMQRSLSPHSNRKAKWMPEYDSNSKMVVDEQNGHTLRSMGYTEKDLVDGEGNALTDAEGNPIALDKRYQADLKRDVYAPDEDSYEGKFYSRIIGGQNVGEVRQQATRMAEQLAAVYFDKRGNLISDEEEAVRRGFKAEYETDPDTGKETRVSAVKVAARQWRKLKEENPYYIRALYNMKFRNKPIVEKDGKPEPIPGEEGFVTQVGPEAKARIDSELEKKVKYRGVEEKLREAGVPLTGEAHEKKKIIDLKELLRDADFAARNPDFISEDEMHSYLKDIYDESRITRWDSGAVHPDLQEEYDSKKDRLDEINEQLDQGDISYQDKARLNRDKEHLEEEMDKMKGWFRPNRPREKAKGEEDWERRQYVKNGREAMLAISEEKKKALIEELKKKIDDANWGLSEEQRDRLAETLAEHGIEPKKRIPTEEEAAQQGAIEATPGAPRPAHEAPAEDIVPPADVDREEEGPEEEGPAPAPRMREKVSPQVLSESQKALDEMKRQGMSPSAYDAFYEQQIESGEMLSAEELERREKAANQEETDKIRGLKTALAAGKNRKGKTASGATLLGLNFNDPEIRKALGIQEGQLAVRFDNVNEGRADQKAKAGAKLIDIVRGQLEEQGLGEDDIEEQLSQLKTTLDKNGKIVLADNNAWESRIESIRGHELRGHDLAQQFIDAETGAMNERGKEFYETLSEAQQKIVDKIGMEEFAAEALGVGDGDYKLENDSRRYLRSNDIKYYENGVAGEEPSDEDLRAFAEKDMATEAVSDRDLQITGAVAKGGDVLKKAGGTVTAAAAATVEGVRKMAESVPDLYEDSVIKFMVDKGVREPAQVTRESLQEARKKISNWREGRREKKRQKQYGKAQKAIDQYSGTVAENDVNGRLEARTAARARQEDAEKRRDALVRRGQQHQANIAEYNEKARAAKRQAATATGEDKSRLEAESAKWQGQARIEEKKLGDVRKEVDAQNRVVEEAAQDRMQAEGEFNMAVRNNAAAMEQLEGTIAGIVSKLDAEGLKMFQESAREGILGGNYSAQLSTMLESIASQQTAAQVESEMTALEDQQGQLDTMQQEKLRLQFEADDFEPQYNRYKNLDTIEAQKVKDEYAAKQQAVADKQSEIDTQRQRIAETQQRIGELEAEADEYRRDALKYQQEAVGNEVVKNEVDARTGGEKADEETAPEPPPEPTTPSPTPPKPDAKPSTESAEQPTPERVPPTPEAQPEAAPEPAFAEAEAEIEKHQKVIDEKRKQIEEMLGSLREAGAIPTEVPLTVDQVLEMGDLDEGMFGASAAGLKALKKEIADARAEIANQEQKIQQQAGERPAAPEAGQPSPAELDAMIRNEAVQNSLGNLSAVSERLQDALDEATDQIENLPDMLADLGSNMDEFVTTISEQTKAAGDRLSEDEKKAADQLGNLVQTMRRDARSVQSGPGGVLDQNNRLLLGRMVATMDAMKTSMNKGLSAAFSNAQRAYNTAARGSQAGRPDRQRPSQRKAA